MTTSLLFLSEPLRCARCARPLEASLADLHTQRAQCMFCMRTFAIDPTSVTVGVRAAVPDTLRRVETSDAAESCTWSHRPRRAIGINYICLGAFAMLFFGSLCGISVFLGPEFWLIGSPFGLFALLSTFLVYAGIQSLRARAEITVDPDTIAVTQTTRRPASLRISRGDALAVDACREATGWAARVIGKDRRATVLLGALREDEARHLVGELRRALARRDERCQRSP